MSTAYLIHGTSSRDDDWFPWLEQAVEPDFDLERLYLPDPYQPVQEDWNEAVDEQIPAEDGVTLGAHSLGCITALRFIERQRISHANLVLVGAFDQPLPDYPELDNFMKPAPRYDRITPKVDKAVVITAVDDPIAPFEMAVKVANQLQADLIARNHGGHFLASDGYTKFPLVLEELQKIMKNNDF
jgi:predicted alpha/beta hydrolase family esterase